MRNLSYAERRESERVWAGGWGRDAKKGRTATRVRWASFPLSLLTFHPPPLLSALPQQRYGVKVYGGQPVKAGGIIVRQLGTVVSDGGE